MSAKQTMTTDNIAATTWRQRLATADTTLRVHLMGIGGAGEPDRAHWVAVDHEGGRVQRFREGFTAIPPMRVIGRQYRTDANGALARGLVRV